MTGPKAWLGNIQGKLSHLVVPENEEVLKQNGMSISEGHRSLLKENSETKDGTTHGSKYIK